MLEAAGYRLRYYEVGTEDLASASSADILIVLGGPIAVYNTDEYPYVSEVIDMVRSRLSAQLPTIGICLGAQVIARALGAQVASGTKEIGWAPVTLHDPLPENPLSPLSNMPVLHWHGDVMTLPAEAKHLASTSSCEVQAFSVGSYCLALQFHVEVDVKLFEGWLIGHAAEIHSSGISVQELRADAMRFGATTAKQGAIVLQNWLAALQQ